MIYWKTEIADIRPKYELWLKSSTSQYKEEVFVVKQNYDT